MNEFFNFLNQQNGDRLVGYCAVSLIALYLIIEGITTIFRSAFAAIRRVRPKQSKTEK
jgi:hypothetical protein